MRTRIWFDPPLFRWSRVLVIATVGIAGSVAWLAYQRGIWPVIEVGPPGVVLAPAASGVAASAVPPRTVVAAARVPATPSAGTPAGASAPVSAPGDVDVCGKGLVAVRPDRAEPGLDDAPRQRLESSLRERWLAGMRARSDARTRAAGLLLASGQLDGESATEQLVRLAQGSGDAAVYGWALHACHDRKDVRPPNACLMLSYDHWAALAPSQAIPWLYIASDEARPRRVDPAEAIFRASRAETLGSTHALLPALVLGAQPADAGPVDRYAMLNEALAVSAAIGARMPYPSRYCATALLADANRRQQCEALGQLFANKAETVMDLVVAKGLGGSLGWPAERLRAIGDEAAALQGMAAAGRNAGGVPTGCAAIDRLVDQAREVARLGELGAAREAVRRSGKTMQELAAGAPKERTAASARLMPAASAPGP